MKTENLLDTNISECVRAMEAGDRRALSQAITLVESSHGDHRKKALELLASLDSQRLDSQDVFKVGISGLPGAGKSTLIAALGLEWIQRGHKVGVCAIDPSSGVSGGSILGDKTRMHKLSSHKNAFVRPTPTRQILGGVSARTREVMALMMVAGFDRILVETVGVGQSESECANMVDLLCVLQLARTGDDLQTIKKGLTEYADVICIHKADDPKDREIQKTLNMWKQACSYVELQESTYIQKPVGVMEVSSKTHHNLKAFLSLLESQFQQLKMSKQLAVRRNEQSFQFYSQECHKLISQGITESKAYQNMLSVKTFHARTEKILPSVLAAQLSRELLEGLDLA